jgi:hypothetical protein
MSASEDVDLKHDKYKEQYVPCEEYWGMGIETETYVEVFPNVTVPANFLTTKKRERYSVNYWTQYAQPVQSDTIQTWIDCLPQKGDTPINLPYILNGHAFSKCDRQYEHITTYTKVPRPNPNFLGTTLLDDLSGAIPDVFGSDAKDVWWVFDGDTVEFMTLQFYNAKMEDTIAELRNAKQRWIDGLRKGWDLLHMSGRPCWPPVNYGFAVFSTNPNAVAIFNNGTYHINLTLPTYLDKEGNVANMERFRTQHQAAARLFQWISPLLIARWGSGDPHANILKKAHPKFPAGSQRVAACRYIGLGIYDTETMREGKLLPEPKETLPHKWWSDMYGVPGCGYVAQDMIGFDINYHKYQNHGLEFRIFDWFPEDYLEEVMRCLIWMLDASLQREREGGVPNPQKSEEWNRLVANCVWNGQSALLNAKQLNELRAVTGVTSLYPDKSGYLDAPTAYTRLWEGWADQWNYTKGTCSHKMIRTPLLRPMLPHMSWMIEEIPETTYRLKTIVRLVRKVQLKPLLEDEEIRPHRIQTVPLVAPPRKWWCC